ncbi:MAG: pyrimidine-nucleoside phosphorylase [Bacilli bacterium]
MIMNEIIMKKRDKHVLSDEEIKFFVEGYTKGEIPDYQVSALLMAIVLNGMNKKETNALTMAMLHSGETVDLSKIKGPKVDKHSTGGVGDKTSLVLGPLVASCGVKVAKMSGRGLGHTGGTLDKLESIPGMRIDLSPAQFEKQVNDIGISIIGQTGNLVPADKKLYALRDVTGTVRSVSLVAASIMSKKLATGADAICLDVKYGSGAFFEDVPNSVKLAKTMIAIGDSMGVDTRAVISNMQQPLGFAVGNNLEVKEAIATLKGNGPADLIELCLEAGSVMLVQAKLYKSYDKARAILEKNLKNGKAYERFYQMVKAQGGDVSYLEQPEKFINSKHIIPVISSKNGYVDAINALEIGEASMLLGAGRAKKEDSIDYASGIVLCKKCGYQVKKGDVLAYLHTDKDDYKDQIKLVEKAFVITSKQVKPEKIVKKVVE